MLNVSNCVSRWSYWCQRAPSFDMLDCLLFTFRVQHPPNKTWRPQHPPHHIVACDPLGPSTRILWERFTVKKYHGKQRSFTCKHNLSSFHYKTKEFYTDSHSHSEVGDIGKWRHEKFCDSKCPASSRYKPSSWLQLQQRFIHRPNRMTSNIRHSLRLKPNKDSSPSLENGWTNCLWQRSPLQKRRNTSQWNSSQDLSSQPWKLLWLSVLWETLIVHFLRFWPSLKKRNKSRTPIHYDDVKDVKQRMRYQGSKLSILSHEDLAALYGLVEIKFPNCWKKKWEKITPNSKSVPSSCGVGQIWNSSASLEATKMFGIRVPSCALNHGNFWENMKILFQGHLFPFRIMTVTGTCADMHQCTPILAKLQSQGRNMEKNWKHVKLPGLDSRRRGKLYKTLDGHSVMTPKTIPKGPRIRLLQNT